MPKIRPAPKADRQAFSKQLPKGQRPLFSELAHLVDHHRTDLDWYHAVGKLVRDLRDLRDAIPADQSKTGWAADLADALGVSPSLLQKANRFVQLYPTAKDYKPLQELGLDWTRLYLTFAVKGRQARQAFQRRAVKDGWSPKEVRFRIQQAQGSRQRAGGRPRQQPASYGPEVALREMARLSQRWQESRAGLGRRRGHRSATQAAAQGEVHRVAAAGSAGSRGGPRLPRQGLAGRAGHGDRPAAEGGAGRGGC